jgi:hypothetical protein
MDGLFAVAVSSTDIGTYIPILHYYYRKIHIVLQVCFNAYNYKIQLISAACIMQYLIRTPYLFFSCTDKGV